jgi:hypothetical protein
MNLSSPLLPALAPVRPAAAVALLFGITALLLANSPAHAAGVTHAQFNSEHRAFLNDYCVECHTAEKQKGKVRLDQISFTLDTVQGADLWQKVLNQINSGEMPPEDSKQPERAAKTEFLDALSHTLMAARRSLGDSGGKITMRRLNRREYKNTIRDLLGVTIDVRDLPADGGAGTFDTAGSSLFMSSDQLEQYLVLGRKALDESFARFLKPSVAAPKTEKLRRDPEEWANKYMPIYAEGYQKKYARFKSWCDAVDEAAAQPENATIVEKIRADPRLKTQPHLFYNHFAEIAGAPGPAQFEFRDQDDAQFARSEYTYHHQYHLDYQKLPQRETGAYLMLYSLGRYTGIAAPPTWPAGRYILRARVAATEEAPPERRFIELGAGKADASDFNVVSSHQVTGTLANPQLLEIPVTLQASGERNFTLRDKRPNNRNAEYAMFREAWDKTGSGPRPCIWVDFLELEGPLPNSPQSTLAKTEHIEPESKTPEIQRIHDRSRVQFENYQKWQTSGGDVGRLSEFGFRDKDTAEFHRYVWEQNSRWFQQYLDWPKSNTGFYLDNTVNETSEYALTLPPDAATGDYMMRVKIGRVPETPAERAFLSLVEASPIDKDDRTFLANRQVTATLDQPEILEIPFRIVPNGPRKFILMEKRPLKKEGISLPGRTRLIKDPRLRDPALWIDWIEWQGPLHADDEGRLESLLTARTQDAAGARELIGRFATRAFRDRVPHGEYLDKLMRLFEIRTNAGDDFQTALKEPLGVVLASPRFLYLNEPADEQRPRSLDAFELATRLSYFLWSAPPDDTLLALARSGELLQPNVLSQQTDRLILNDKSREFVTGFTHQWLRMERLDFFQFNTQLYRDFDDSTKAAARNEVFYTVEHVLRTNASICDLLKADYVVVNGLLAAFYGIEGISGDAFRKVSLPSNSPRGGLLGMAAILAMGSNGEHTSPVERGAWVLRFLLNAPPPNAPANVPQLTRLNSLPLTTRERLLAHQEQPQCASCHRAIDPIGFGLENFNTVGKWRTEDSYQPVDANGKPIPKLLKHWTIDASSALHKGPAFKDYFELRDIIASKPEAFARGLVEHLIAYALGRPFGFTDEDLAVSMVERAKGKNFAMRELIQALVNSSQFQSK